MTRVTRSGLFSVLVAAALREKSTAVEIAPGRVTINITYALDLGPRSRPHIATPRRKAQWKSETRGRRS